VHRSLVGKPEGLRPLGRQRHRWVDNIKMDFAQLSWERIFAGLVEMTSGDLL
jgi:hypothetical protein